MWRSRAATRRGDRAARAGANDGRRAGGIDAIIEGDLDFALARAKRSVDGPRARELAERAKHAYARSKEPSFQAEVDAWEGAFEQSSVAICT